MTGQTQPASKTTRKVPRLPLSELVDPDQEVDTHTCYMCQHEASARCAHCKLPICEEHRQQVLEIVTKIPLTLCEECADHYEGVIMPQLG